MVGISLAKSRLVIPAILFDSCFVGGFLDCAVHPGGGGHQGISGGVVCPERALPQYERAVCGGPSRRTLHGSPTSLILIGNVCSLTLDSTRARSFLRALVFVQWFQLCFQWRV